ncbi:glycoside hydrolase family 113 [Leeuwenhoekiella sp. NPDC079379]|uniref:glycoside hydrolase family 113 n=1 Tax=Leeuwenhoekiella sp. NPDC079379 TaxID=3364122 RepID=UPI0037C889EF
MKKSLSLIITNIILFVLIGCSATPVIQDKINGVSFVSSRDTLVQSHIEPVLKIKASHAAIMPFAFVRDKNNPELIFNTERQWYGERYQGARQYIEALHTNKIKVMLKPHIWIWKGVFTGDMEMNTEEEWGIFEQSYETYILLYAALAEETNVEIFCIGTELYNFTNARKAFWEQLIKKVRGVYTGKLTYAENWDKVDKVTFWSQLDYIGADAYFPVSELETPAISDAKAGWEHHKQLLLLLSKKHNKPVLFTEFGYRSADYAGKEPWTSDRHEGKMNAKAQSNLYEAVFEEFWDEPWFAGGFVWKWFHNYERAALEENNRFTPQGKPAEEVLKKWYSRM